MLRKYRHLAPLLTLCTMFAIDGTAHAATTITPDAAPTAAEMAAARRAIPDEFRKAEADRSPLTFTVGHADINGDGRPDLIIHFTNPCVRSGCFGYVLIAGPGAYSTHAIPLVFFVRTVTVLNGAHHGMHNLRFDDSTAVFHFTGTDYEFDPEQ